MKSRTFAVLAAVAALTAGGAAAQADTVKIGFNVPLTGFAAADGTSALTGAELAVEQANAEGGVNGEMVELVVLDDQASPKQAGPVATKLIEQQGVKVGVSGSYSGATRAAAGVYQAAGVPYIAAYAVHPEITRSGEYVFRTSFVGEVQGRAGAKLLGDMMGKKKVVLITLKNDFGQSLAAGFKEAAGQFGIEIVNEYEYGIKDRQFGPIVSKVKSDDPEAIYASGYFFTAGPLVSQLRAAGIQVPVIGPSPPPWTGIPTRRPPRTSSRPSRRRPVSGPTWWRPRPTLQSGSRSPPCARPGLTIPRRSAAPSPASPWRRPPASSRSTIWARCARTSRSRWSRTAPSIATR
jgi:branched-chain amino acid transport system substrate-binding protein